MTGLRLFRLHHQCLALFDQGLRQRHVEFALRQREGLDFALAGLARLIARDQPHVDGKPGPGMRGQVIDGRARRLFRRRALERDRELRRIEQEHAIAGDAHFSVLHVGQFEARFHAGDAIIVGRLPLDAERAIGFGHLDYCRRRPAADGRE